MDNIYDCMTDKLHRPTAKYNGRGNCNVSFMNIYYLISKKAIEHEIVISHKIRDNMIKDIFYSFIQNK